MSLKMKLLGIAALVLITLSGCATVTPGDPARDTQLKKFSSPADGKAGVYVYRNEVMGAAIGMDVEVDGQPLGRTASKTYLYTEVTPGPHQVKSKAENEDVLPLDTVAGKLYYVWQEVKMGIMMARTKLHLVDEVAGQAGVQESALVVK